MKLKTKQEFQEYIQSLDISTDYIVIKPNWYSNLLEKFTGPEMLTWLMECFKPEQQIVVIESYTPWRGLEKLGIEPDNDKGVDLIEGKTHWDYYRNQDNQFLNETGIDEVLKKYNATYLNITNEYWKNHCCDSSLIEKRLVKRGFNLTFKELSSYIPKKLYEICDKSTFISISRIKLQTQTPPIMISVSLKNVFGLIPRPVRMVPYHGENHQSTPYAIADINKIYASLFEKSLWINDGLRSVVYHYFAENEYIEYDTGLLFAGQNPIEVDSQTCMAVQVNPNEVPYIQMLKGVWKID